MTVPVTAVKLVDGLAGSILAIHQHLPGPEAFLSLVESGAKLGEVATHPGQPLGQDLVSRSSFPQEGVQVVNSPTGMG